MSFGDIQDTETIGYVIFDPDHIGKDGNVSKAAFQTQQLEECSLSICRILYSTVKEVEDKIISPRLTRAIAAGKEKACCGILTAICQEIRNLSDSDGNNYFIVKDDPLDDFLSHGLIGFTEVVKNASRSVKTAAQANLLRIFGKIKEIEKVFES